MSVTFNPETKVLSSTTIPYPLSMDTMLSDFVTSTLAKTPERVLQVAQCDDSSITCDNLRISSIRVAQNLAKIGIKEDDVVGIIAPQSHFATFIIHGCATLGAIINPLHAAMSETDIFNVFSQTKPKIIICQPDVIAKVESALENADFHYRIYSTSTETSPLNAQDFLRPTGVENDFQRPKFTKPSDQKVFAILCSSGTTGVPKGVCISHATVLYWIALISIMPQSEARGVTYCSSPIYWATGFFANVTPFFMLNDVRIVPEDKPFSPKDFLEAVEKYQITSATIPPPHLASLLHFENLASYHCESIKDFMSTGSIISKTLRQKFSAQFPDKHLATAYGMTEASVSMSKPNEYKHEYCVGSMIFPNTHIKIVDDDGNNLSAGERGEICVRSAFKFMGYYNNPEATENCFDKDGFFKSGDIGYFNEEGMLFVIDRKKEVLKCKGHQVNPSEIEDIIQSIGGVELVSVVGIANDFVGNLLTAAVVRKKGHESLQKETIIEFVASKVSDYKQLHGGVFFFNELPMTPSGKVQKRFVLEKILKART